MANANEDELLQRKEGFAIQTKDGKYGVLI